MNFSLPPEYVATPAWVIDSAFEKDPPKRALLGSYSRLLSLAWNRKDRSTPVMREEDVLEFLCMKRRQFFEVVDEMEGLGWLRSSRPRAGFVQFFFHAATQELVTELDSAKNRTVSAKNRTDLMRIEEEESLNSLNTNPPHQSSTQGVRKIAQMQEIAPEMRLLVEHLHLLFEPDRYGLLEWRDEFATGIPERVKGWIAKAYQDRERLDNPIGLIVKHILAQDAPHNLYLTTYSKILPDAYLEAIGEIEYACAFCSVILGTSAIMDAHRRELHPHICEECSPERSFESAEALKAHYEETHDPYRVRKPSLSVLLPTGEGGSEIEQMWLSVLVKLQDEMPRASFDTWVRDSQAVSYDGNKLIVGVRNAYTRDWLTNRLTAKVNGLLTDGITVEFMVMQEMEA